MESSLKKRNELWNRLYQKLNTKLNDVVFIELNKNVALNDSLKISKAVPLPLRSEYLIQGIKSNDYADHIKLDKIVISMMYVLGCTSDFKYKSDYIKILKSTGVDIDSYIMTIALNRAKEEKYWDALILLIALDKISDMHKYIRYNIALTLKQLTSSRGELLKKSNKEEAKDEEYELYYNLSFTEFLKLEKDYPDFGITGYHLGFYYLNEKKYQMALSEWERVMDSDEDESVKDEVSKLIEELKDIMEFEYGKECVLKDNLLGGLRRLIPLVKKYDDWSEAKYFTALAYRKLGNYKKAMSLLNELIESGEDFSEIYNELGLCYISFGDIKNAIKNLERAVKAKEYDTGYLCNLGLAYYSAGKTKKAKECIDKAYSISPDDEITKQCKIWADRIME
jgi:tetratricopeptide (TPR) repeat protein